MAKIEVTELPGVGPKTAEKLNSAGIMDVDMILTRSAIELSEITGMDSESAANLIKKARNLLKKDLELFRTGDQVMEDRKNIITVSTGCKAFDELLMGGLEMGASTEIYGQFGSGKTQFCHTMAVQVINDERLKQNEQKARVLWIDTEHTFRPERIVSIAEAKGYDPNEAIKNIIHTKVTSTTVQQLVIEEAEKMIKDKNIRLIVVDSTTGLFRSEFLGRGTLSGRQQALNRFLGLIGRFADHYGIAVIFSNQVMDDPSVLPGMDPKKPIGGNVMGHASTYRIYLRSFGKSHTALMKDSPHHPDGEVAFIITNAGISDPEEKKSKKKSDDEL